MYKATYAIYLCGLLITNSLFAIEYESFTEPNLQIEVASAEIGILLTVKVKEGQTVKKGQVLAILDSRILNSSLNIARAKRNTKGKLNSALAMRKLYKAKLNRLLPLLKQGHAQRAEVDQVRAELVKAKANVQIASEESKIYGLEAKRIKTQINNRTIYSPINGVVAELKKYKAEIVNNMDATILTLVNINPLRIIIHVPTTELFNFKKGETVKLNFPNFVEKQADGKIDFISPVTDASSDTTKIEIKLNNAKNKFRSGIKCIVTK
jgi:RND family efflux transporter MFP subunit